MAFLDEIDPEAIYKKPVPLTLTISIEEVVGNSEIIDAISNSLTKVAPVSTTQIDSLYEVYFDR